VTKKPVIFINTPPKINNPEYDVIEVKPLEITLRDKIGIQIDLNRLNELRPAIEELIRDGDKYASKITEIRNTYIANFGRSAEIGGQYIINKITRKDKR
jgi:YidC/Oxa1 family membrane protein insertase